MIHFHYERKRRLTCQTNGRFLRLRKAKRMARIFHGFLGRKRLIKAPMLEENVMRFALDAHTPWRALKIIRSTIREREKCRAKADAD